MGSYRYINKVCFSSLILLFCILLNWTSLFGCDAKRDSIQQILEKSISLNDNYRETFDKISQEKQQELSEEQNLYYEDIALKALSEAITYIIEYNDTALSLVFVRFICSNQTSADEEFCTDFATLYYKKSSLVEYALTKISKNDRKIVVDILSDGWQMLRAGMKGPDSQLKLMDLKIKKLEESL
jgi:hypothetical protein